MIFGGCANSPKGGCTPSTSSNAAYKFDVTQFTWNRLPTMPRKRRSHHACGIINGEGVPRKVVAAGGYDYAAKSAVNTVDILDLKTLRWTAGMLIQLLL